MTIFIIGDSTVDDNKPPFRGWGWAIPELVKEGVKVVNCALSGCSSRSFVDKGLFTRIETEMTAGDVLLIQFGHNDEKEDERHTDVETTFPIHLAFFCDIALAKGAKPVLITPVERRFFTGDGGLLYTHGEYPRAIRDLAEKKGLPLIDLNAATRKLYLSLGADETAKLFVRLALGENEDFPNGHNDQTHYNADGAKAVGGLVAEGMKRYPALAELLRQE